MERRIVELAKMLKERDNVIHSGIQIGEVVDGFPDIKIRISDEIMLDKSHLVFAAHTLTGYSRQFDSSGNITIGTTNSFTSNGTVTFKDSFVSGDQVILIPTQNEQLYFVLDKAVRL